MDPELHKSLIELGMVPQVAIDMDRVDVTLALTTLGCPLKDQIVDDVKRAVGALEGVKAVEVALTEMTEEERRRIGIGVPEKGSAEDLNVIRHVIAVMSGKGGVGKSLVSGLLAIALSREGYEVGILDADITGPSIPKMFFPNGARLGYSSMGPVPPKTQTGIRVMSINLLLDQEDQAVVWRGPLDSGAIKQFWGDIFWGTLDYMVVRKAANMAQQMHTPILGLIENMSYFECPDTGKRYDLFGRSHAEKTTRRLGVPFLGHLPIDPEVARLCDAGLIEEYAGEVFAPIAQDLAMGLPEARRPSFM